MKKNLRNDFPIFKQQINGSSLIYFDNAATTQKPQQVIDCLVDFYSTKNANVHRGVYQLAEQATQLYEQARATVARFINADPSEIIFTSGTTESINLIAATWGECDVIDGDDIVLSELEHHSNLVPWQLLAYKADAVLKFIPVQKDGTLDMRNLGQLITENTKLVSVTQLSNSIGTHVDLQQIVKAAHAVDAMVVVDAAQSIAHQPIDVKKMQCDFLAFSGHKILGPTGVGVLYIKKDLHESMPPYKTGGGMVNAVEYNQADWRTMPHKFEAGTPPIAQAIALARALEYLQENVSWQELQKHEAALCTQLIDGLSQFSSVRLLGPIAQLKEKGPMVSFVVDGMHAHDVAAFFDKHGIAIRAGHHCAQPLAKKMDVDASLRVSFYLYNTEQEVERFLHVFKLLHQEL